MPGFELVDEISIRLLSRSSRQGFLFSLRGQNTYRSANFHLISGGRRGDCSEKVFPGILFTGSQWHWGGGFVLIGIFFSKTWRLGVSLPSTQHVLIGLVCR